MNRAIILRTIVAALVVVAIGATAYLSMALARRKVIYDQHNAHSPVSGPPAADLPKPAAPLLAFLPETESAPAAVQINVPNYGNLMKSVPSIEIQRAENIRGPYRRVVTAPSSIHVFVDWLNRPYALVLYYRIVPLDTSGNRGPASDTSVIDLKLLQN